MGMTAAVDFRGFLEWLRSRGKIIDMQEPIDLNYEIGAPCE